MVSTTRLLLLLLVLLVTMERLTLFARLCAARTPSVKKAGPARAGAKIAKHLERLQSAGPILDPEEATAFRALAARANYLAQDRPDSAFATK